MSFFFDSNSYSNKSILTNSTVTNCLISSSAINTTSLDMYDSLGQYQNIINVKDPINPQDAATKHYVDYLGIIYTITLNGTSPVLFSNTLKGCFVITITNIVLNGPCAIFNVIKNEASHQAQIIRTAAAPGYTDTLNLLHITWPINSGLYLSKSGIGYDGSYQLKII